MTLLQPLFLIVCLGALLPLSAFRGRALVPAGLPAGWSRLVAPDMRAIAQRHVIPSRDLASAAISALLWLCLGLALSEPVLQDGDGDGAANLAGRVLVLDMSDDSQSEAVRVTAARLAEALPEVPVALVAATGDAFDIVPFTTDRQHIRRYLTVLSRDVMPVGGHEPLRAIAHAEAMLVRAGMIAGQTVLITSTTVAPTGQLARDRWLRAIVSVRASGEAPAGLQATADQSDAVLIAQTDLNGLDNALTEAIAALVEDSPELSGNTPLQPWLIGLCCLLWLFQCRRPS